MRRIYDIAVFGSGFAGSLMAMIAKRQGHSVLLLERGKHPRMTIGESSTPLANLLLDELALRYDLPTLRPLTKWGSWQRTYPHLACGLKRGFTFYHHEIGALEAPDPEHQRQLLVAASPHDQIADTHWYRADFDSFFVDQAQAMGVDYLDEVKIGRVSEEQDGVSFEAVKDGQQSRFQAGFAIDATGPLGLLHKALQLPELRLENYPATRALYSHFSGVELPRPALEAEVEAAPYPTEAAAVHHVFDGGWIWVLRFNNGITSAGVAAKEEEALHLNLQEGEPAWQRLLQSIPTLNEQFARARLESPFTYKPNFSSMTGQVRGRRWTMLPSSAGFIDPLFSTGFPLTLLGIGRLAEILRSDWNSAAFETDLQSYAAQTTGELVATSRLIGSLYANMGNFAVFKAISLLYFAAASYSETARRLGKSHLAQSFLLHDHPTFGPTCKVLLERARHSRSEQESVQLIEDIHCAIEPFDVAGLSRPNKKNRYPADAEDLLRSASKVESRRDEIEVLLQSCGFYEASQV